MRKTAEMMAAMEQRMNRPAETAIDRVLSADGGLLPLIAVVFTPFQLLFLESLAAEITERPLFVVDARPERFRLGRAPRLSGAVVCEVALTGKVNDSDQSRLVGETAAAMAEHAGGRPFGFLCASYQWPLNNVFFTRHRSDPAAHFFLIEDGLSTFLTLEQSASEKVRNLVREGVARLRGFPRRTLFTGHPLGLDLPEIEGIFTRVEPLASTAAARPYIRLAPPAVAVSNAGAGDVLFVGQPYMQAYGEAAMLPFLRAVRDDLKARGFNRLAFKPHHFQPPEEVRHYTDLGFELVDPPVTVEEMIPGSTFRTVASINTTALLTTKSLYGEAVQAIAYGAGRFSPKFEKRDEREVLAVFRRAGVEMVEL